MSFQANPQVYKITARDGFLNVLVRANQDCDLIRSGLGGFLERKRGKFPRMFFLSNEELVEIFGKGFNLIGTMIETGEQTFIPTLFEGIDRLKLDETTQEILGMQSKQMEYV
jgi:dynein heavy chain, axonemal